MELWGSVDTSVAIRAIFPLEFLSSDLAGKMKFCSIFSVFLFIHSFIAGNMKSFLPLCLAGF